MCTVVPEEYKVGAVKWTFKIFQFFGLLSSEFAFIKAYIIYTIC